MHIGAVRVDQSGHITNLLLIAEGDISLGGENIIPPQFVSGQLLFRERGLGLAIGIASVSICHMERLGEMI